MFPDKFVVTVTTKDFRTSDYLDNQNCALAKALKRKFSEVNFVNPFFLKEKDDVSFAVHVNTVTLDGNRYHMSDYCADEIENRCDLPNQKSLKVTLTKEV